MHSNLEKERLLQEGIAAIKRGDKLMARSLLQVLAEQSPDDARAWFWLASTAASSEELLRCLEKAQQLAPGNEQIRKGLLKALFQAGTQAAGRDKARARPLFARAVELDPDNVTLWAWRVTVAGSRDEALRCVERILELDPSNQQALRWREQLGPPQRPAADPPAGPAEARPAGEPRPREPEPPPPAEASARPVPGSAAPPPASAAPEPPAPAEVYHPFVLIVDDSATVRNILQMTLEKAGCRVLTAPDGMQAVARLSEFIPELVFLDINMPGIDGYEVCKIIRRNQALRHVPVIMLSGKDGLFDKFRGRMAGTTEYLTKPFHAAEIVAVVQRHCSRLQGG